MKISINDNIQDWAARLRDISAFGLTFCKNSYDLENYEKIQKIAIEMTALLIGKKTDDFEPIKKNLIGRPTPLITIDAAIINPNRELLLVRRVDNKEWSFPGGYLNIGETPFEGVKREVHEEVSINILPEKIIGIYDVRKRRNAPLNQVSLISFLCYPSNWSTTNIIKFDKSEILEVKWCNENIINEFNLDPYFKSHIKHSFYSLENNFVTYFDCME